MKRNLMSVFQQRKQPDWRPPEWPATQSPAIWRAVEGWRGRGYDIVAHSDRRLDPCSSCRAGGYCRIELRSCGRSLSPPLTYRHVRTVGDRMLRAPYRSARRLLLPTATARLPDWTISVCAMTTPCRQRFYYLVQGTARK